MLVLLENMHSTSLTFRCKKVVNNTILENQLIAIAQSTIPLMHGVMVMSIHSRLLPQRRSSLAIVYATIVNVHFPCRAKYIWIRV